MELDLFMIDCGRKEGIFSQPSLINHSVTMNAETGEIMFKIEDRTISTLHLRSNTQGDRSISGISHEKPDKKQGQTHKKARNPFRLKNKRDPTNDEAEDTIEKQEPEVQATN